MRAWIVALALGVGCAGPNVDGDAGSDAAVDAPVAVDAGPLAPTSEVDLLLVYDGTGATADSGGYAWQALQAIVERLVAGDRDGDGDADFAPVASVHFALTDFDMGLGSFADVVTPPGVFSVGGPCSPDGTGGLLAPMPSDVTTCASSPAQRFAVLDGAAGPSGLTTFAQTLDCVLPDLSMRHCSYPSPLDAALRALAPAPTPSGGSPWSFTRDGYAPPVFRDGALGRGNDDATNGGFLRPDSALVVVIVSEHDDCSVPSVEPFVRDTDHPVWSALRCTELPESDRQPISRFVDGLIGLRRDPRRFVLALWSGVPERLSGAEPDAILADPAMQPESYFSENPMEFQDACINSRGFAYPAPRLVAFARDAERAGAYTSVLSLCSDLREAPSAVLVDVVAALGR